MDLVWEDKKQQGNGEALQWEIRNSYPNQSGIVKAAQPFGLYNTKKNDFLVHCGQRHGISLEWARDCNRPTPNYKINGRGVKSFLYYKASRPGSPSCQANGSFRATYRMVLRAGAGGAGPTEPFTVTGTWDSSCHGSVAEIPLLRRGIWKIDSQAGNFHASCMKELPGMGQPYFQLSSRGCYFNPN